MNLYYQCSLYNLNLKAGDFFSRWEIVPKTTLHIFSGEYTC